MRRIRVAKSSRTSRCECGMASVINFAEKIPRARRPRHDDDWKRSLLRIPRAAESQVIQPRIHRGVTSAGNAIVGAEVFRAHPGAAAHGALLRESGALRILPWTLRVIRRRIPIGAPFPDISRHLVKAVRIGRETLYRRNTRKAVFCLVARGKTA